MGYLNRKSIKRNIKGGAVCDTLANSVDCYKHNYKCIWENDNCNMRLGYKTFSIETCALCYSDFEDIDMRISLCPCDDKHIICHQCLERTFLENIARVNWFELPKILCQVITVEASRGRGHQKCQLEYPMEKLINLLSISVVDILKRRNVLRENYLDLFVDPFTQNMMTLNETKVTKGEDRLLQCPKCFWIIDYSACENLGSHVLDAGRERWGNLCPGKLENGEKCGYFAQFTNFYIRNADNYGLTAGQMPGIGNRYHAYKNGWEIEDDSCHGSICTYINKQTNQVVTGNYEERPIESIGIAPEIDLNEGRKAYVRVFGGDVLTQEEQDRLSRFALKYEKKLGKISMYSTAHIETYYKRNELHKHFFWGTNPITPDTISQYNKACLELIEDYYQKNLKAPPITPKSNVECAMPMENPAGSAAPGGGGCFNNKFKISKMKPKFMRKSKKHFRKHYK